MGDLGLNIFGERSSAVTAPTGQEQITRCQANAGCKKHPKRLKEKVKYHHPLRYPEVDARKAREGHQDAAHFLPPPWRREDLLLFQAM